MNAPDTNSTAPQADQADGLRRMNSPRPVKVITVTGGKGGVGKTNVCANLAIAMAQLGRRVMILDADLGLANVDVLFGLQPQLNLSDVVRGDHDLEEIILDGPSGVRIRARRVRPFGHDRSDAGASRGHRQCVQRRQRRSRRTAGRYCGRYLGQRAPVRRSRARGRRRRMRRADVDHGRLRNHQTAQRRARRHDVPRTHQHDPARR